MNRDHQKSAVSRQSATVQSVSHFKDINLSWLSQSHRALLWWHQDGGAYWARASGSRDVLISNINAEGGDRRTSHLNKVSERPKVWVENSVSRVHFAAGAPCNKNSPKSAKLWFAGNTQNIVHAAVRRASCTVTDKREFRQQEVPQLHQT